MLVRMPTEKPSDGISASGAGIGPSVALFTAKSRLPNSSTQRSTTARTASSSVTSAGTASARPPALRSSTAVFSSLSSVRAVIATAAPAFANAVAMAAPMPWLPPVTKATRFVKSYWRGMLYAYPMLPGGSSVVGRNWWYVVRRSGDASGSAVPGRRLGRLGLHDLTDYLRRAADHGGSAGL